MCRVERVPRWKSSPTRTKCPSARITLSAPSHALRPSVTRPSTAEAAPAWIGGVAKLGEMPAYGRTCGASADMGTRYATPAFWQSPSHAQARHPLTACLAPRCRRLQARLIWTMRLLSPYRPRSMRSNRRGVSAMRCLFRAALIAALAGLSAPALAHGAHVVLGIPGWTGFGPLTLAKEAGIFKKNGLDVGIKKIPQKDRHLAIASGDIQCAATTVETWISWNANGVATK